MVLTGGKTCATGWPEIAYDRVLLNDVKDVAFFRSRETRSYDAFIVTSDDVSETHAVTRLELVTGEMDVVYGTTRQRSYHFDLSHLTSSQLTSVSQETGWEERLQNVPVTSFIPFFTVCMTEFLVILYRE